MMLHELLNESEFVQSQSDYCLYTKLSDREKFILFVWVGGIVVATSSQMC